MIGWFSQTLGFVSASLVAVIALAFGVLFLFFSGSSLVIVGQFLRFGLRKEVLLPALLGSALATGSLAAAVGAPWPIASAGLQVVATLGVAGLVGARRFLRPVGYVCGAALLATGCVFVASLFAPGLEPAALLAVQAAASLLLLAALGGWPLVIAGLVGHRRVRPVEWFISLRYLVAKRRQTFISIITVISVTGVALGVAVITVVLSVMNGFSRVWEEKIIGARAHFVVQSRLGPFADYPGVRDRVRVVPGVVGATPFLVADAILRSPGGQLQAVVLKGIDAETVGEALEIEQHVVAGSLRGLDADPEAEGDAALPGAVVGAELADRLLLRLGDPLILISPLGGPATPLGPAPRLVRFRVAGIFRANFFQFDESFIYTSLGSAQKFMKLEDVVSGIEVRTEDAYRSAATAERAEIELGGAFWARDWKRFFPGFFRALVMERVMMFVLLSFIMVVAGFIIISTLIMMIMEKARDIAILKAMGCTNDGVLRVFAVQGVLIGIAGIGLGLGMGLVITWNIGILQEIVERMLGVDVLPANVYQLKHFPYDVVPQQLALIGLIAMVLSTGATLLPSWQAARVAPAEALRHD